MGVRVDELIDCHTRVASTFRERGAIQFIKKNSKKLNNNDPVHFGTAFQWSLSFNSLSYPLKIDKINIRRCYCKRWLERFSHLLTSRGQGKVGGKDTTKITIKIFTQDDPYTILTIFLLGRPCPFTPLR